MKLTSVAAAALAVGALAASVLVPASPARAAITDCYSNRACAWIDSNYTGPVGRWASSASSLPGFNDQISSINNRRTTSIGWFQDAGYSGSVFTQAPGGAGFFNWPDWRNDSFSSLYIY